MFQLNLLDTALIVILLFFGIKGLIHGFVQEVAGLAGIAVGIVLSRAFHAPLGRALTSFGISSDFSHVLAVAILFVLGIVLMGLAAHILQTLLRAAFAGGIDRLLGLVAGLAKGIIFAGLIAYIAASLFSDVSVVKNSQVVPPLMRVIQALAGTLDVRIPVI